MQNKALRLCTDAMRSTPSNVLVESEEIPLEFRRNKLRICLREYGDKNTTKSVLNECWEYNRFKRNGFGWKTKDKSEKYDV